VLLDSLQKGLALVAIPIFCDEVVACPIIPNLLNQNSFLQLVEINRDVSRHICVFSDPVDRNLTLDDSYSENFAVGLVLTLQRLVGIVEDIGGKAKNGVEILIAAKDGEPLVLLVLIVYYLDEECEKGVKRPLAPIVVHTRRSETIDCSEYFLIGLLLEDGVVFTCILLINDFDLLHILPLVCLGDSIDP